MADLIFPCKITPSSTLEEDETASNAGIISSNAIPSPRWGSLRLTPSEVRAEQWETIKKELMAMYSSSEPGTSRENCTTTLITRNHNTGRKRGREDNAVAEVNRTSDLPQGDKTNVNDKESASAKALSSSSSPSSPSLPSPGADKPLGHRAGDADEVRCATLLLSYLYGDQPFYPSHTLCQAMVHTSSSSSSSSASASASASMSSWPPRRSWSLVPVMKKPACPEGLAQSGGAAVTTAAEHWIAPVRPEVYSVCQAGLTQMLRLLRALRELDTADYLTHTCANPPERTSTTTSTLTSTSTTPRLSRLVRLYAQLEALLLELDDAWQQCNGKPAARSGGPAAVAGSGGAVGEKQRLWSSVVDRTLQCMDAFEMTVVFDLLLSLDHITDTMPMPNIPIPGGYVAYLAQLLEGFSAALKRERWPAQLLRVATAVSSVNASAASASSQDGAVGENGHLETCMERLRQSLLTALHPVPRSQSPEHFPPSRSSSFSAPQTLSALWDGITVMLMRSIYAVQAADLHNVLGAASRPPLGVLAAAIQAEEKSTGEQKNRTPDMTPAAAVLARLLQDTEGYHRVCAMAWSGRYRSLGLYRAMADMQAVFLALLQQQQQEQNQQPQQIAPQQPQQITPPAEPQHGAGGSTNFTDTGMLFSTSSGRGRRRGRGRGTSDRGGDWASGGSTERTTPSFSASPLFVSNTAVVHKTSAAYIVSLWDVWCESLATEFEGFRSSYSAALRPGATEENTNCGTAAAVRALVRHRPSVFDILRDPSLEPSANSNADAETRPLAPTQQAALRVLHSLRAKDTNQWCSLPSLRRASTDFTAMEFWIQSAAFAVKTPREGFAALRSVLDAIVDACVQQFGPTDERSTAMTVIRQHLVPAAQQERLL